MKRTQLLLFPLPEQEKITRRIKGREKNAKLNKVMMFL